MGATLRPMRFPRESRASARNGRPRSSFGFNLSRELGRIAGGLLLAATALASALACGSRTGLWGSDEATVGVVADSGSGGDATADAPSPAPLPPIDAGKRSAPSRVDCPDAGATLIYVVTASNQLFSFLPTDGSFTFLATLACPTPVGESPFSMAVDRKGVAYVQFTDKRLYRVSTSTGACSVTAYSPESATSQGFGSFGMGYATNDVGPSEFLFVAGSQGGTQAQSPGLGRIAPTSFELTKVGNFLPDIARSELTGTGDGRLFAFYTKGEQSGPPSFIGEIDTQTAHVVAETAFPSVDQGKGWAFAFWGGDFYMFTSPGEGSTVTRFRPLDSSLDVVGRLPTRIVGAGVSTCAPAR